MTRTPFPRLAAYNLSALALTRVSPPPLLLALVLLLAHLLGLGVVAQFMRAPVWLPVVVVTVFAAAQLIPRAREIFAPALFAPFWLVYALVAVRFMWLRVMQGEIGGYFEYTTPDPRVLLRFEFLVAAALVYSALIFAARIFHSRGRAVLAAAAVAACGILAWAAVEYIGHRTSGATGSDPFAYAQMGMDLASRGMASHHFALFPLIATSNIAWYPILHVGYHLPFNLDGDAVTVWSPGGALAYALAYRTAGEAALYLVNPIFSWLSAPIAGLLAFELTRSESRTMRAVSALGVICVMATSNEIVNWAGVTMTDTQALVFTTLAFYCALRFYRTGAWAWVLSVGIFWGAAYVVRHTQLVIAIAFVPLFLVAPFTRRVRLGSFILAGATAFLIAIPDLWYHQTYLGSWLTPESEELALYALNAVPQSLGTIWQSLAIGAEFGWLMLFIGAGIFLFTRRAPILSSVLLLWLVAVAGIHAPYTALRLRDLVPEFPIAAFYGVYGAAAPFAGLYKTDRAARNLVAAVLLFFVVEMGIVRVWNTLPRAVQAPRAQFGAMTTAQRASFDVISQLTPSNAIVGASLNSGAVEAYTHRSSFRPADWCAAGQCVELREFLARAQANGLEIYLLQDDASLSGVLNDLRKTYHLDRVTTLDVPLFGQGAVPDAGALWRLAR